MILLNPYKIDLAQLKVCYIKFLKLMKDNFGERFDKIRFPNSCGIGVKPVSKEGTQRLVWDAIEYAIKYKRKTVTLVHKGNIMKFTEGSFKKWGYEIATSSGALWCYNGTSATNREGSFT